MPGSATHKSRRQADLTDPDSRLLKTKDDYLRGYNAQAVATTDQFVMAAKVANLAVDAPAYAPMIAETEHACTAILARVQAGELDMRAAAEELGVTRARVNQPLRRRRAGDPDPLTTTMIAKLDTPRGRKTYKHRTASIEPVFAQIKSDRGIRNVTRRGVTAADSHES